jgi:hypothetical protein
MKYNCGNIMDIILIINGKENSEYCCLMDIKIVLYG